MNKEEILLPELSEDEREFYKSQCVELAKKYNVSKVHACVQFKYDGTNERIASYYKEPNRPTKLALMSKTVNIGDQYAVAEEIMKLCMLKGESDKLVQSDHPDTDVYYIGAVQYCLGLIQMAQDQFKKK